MDTTISILSEVTNGLKDDVITSLRTFNRKATGKTERAIEVVQNTDNSQLLAPEYIVDLEKGRAPSSPDSDPGLADRLKDWCVARGIDPGARFRIARKIHRFGYEGTMGVLSIPLSDKNVNEHTEKAMQKLASLVTIQVSDSIKI